MSIKRVHIATSSPKPKRRKRKAKAAKKTGGACVKPENIGKAMRPVERLNFDELRQLGADKLLELRRLEQSGKLSAVAFLQQATELAGKDESQLRDLQQRIEQSPVAGPILSFIRKLSRALASSNFPSLPVRKLQRLLWQYGSEDVLPALNVAGASLADAIALAVMAGISRWPESYGVVDDLDAHNATIAGLHKQVARISELLRTNYRPSDIEMESRSLLPGERQKGMVVLRLRFAPRIVLGSDTWPMEALEATLQQAGGPPKPAPAPEVKEPLPPNPRETEKLVILGQAARTNIVELGPAATK